MAEGLRDLFLLDLDRTIFRTEMFMRDLVEAMHSVYGVDQGRFRANAGLFASEASGYDFFGHAQSVTGQSLSALRLALRRALGQRDYLYPDVAAFVRAYAGAARVAVMTGGHEEFQKFKIGLCGVLKDCDIAYCPQAKGPVLAQALVRRGRGFVLEPLLVGRYARVSVVDDNPSVFDTIQPQPGVSLYRMVRPEDNYDKVPNSFFITPVKSLMEVK